MAQYLIMEIREQNEKILNFIPFFFQKFNFVMTRNIENLFSDIIKIKGKFNILRNQLENAENDFKKMFFLLTNFKNFLLIMLKKLYF